jgi:hypothetical protein
MCLFFIILFLGPRLALLYIWLFQTTTFNMAFDAIFWPIIGFLFLPWTTLMYIFIAPGGVIGWDWFWLGLMLMADIASYGGGAYNNRNKF